MKIMNIGKKVNTLKKFTLLFSSLSLIIYVCSQVSLDKAKFNLLFWWWILSLLSFYFLLSNDSPKDLFRSVGKFLSEIIKEKFVLLIILFSLILRLHLISTIPVPEGDEFVQALAARSFLNGESKNMFGTYYWGFSPSFHPFLGSLSLRLLGNDVFAWRIPSVIAGIFAVLMLYKTTQILFSQQVAILASALLASFHIHVFFSRIGTFQTFDAPFLLFTLYFLFKGIDTKKARYFILSGYSCGLSQYFYFGTKIIPLISFLLLSFWLIFKRKKVPIKKFLKYPIIFAASFLIIFSPLLSFYREHPEHYFSRTNTVSIFNNINKNLSESLKKNAIDTAMTFWNRGTFMYYPTNYPIVNHLELLFLIVGIASVFRQITKLESWAVIFCFFGILTFGGILTNDAIESQRVTGVFPFISLLIALGIEKTSTLLAQFLRRNNFVKFFLFILLTTIICGQNIYLLFVRYLPSEKTMVSYAAAATEMAALLKKKQNSGKTVYFFGAPRMYFNSFAILPFWAPLAQGIDVDQGQLPKVESCNKSIFIFLPERLPEKNDIEKLCPNGKTISVGYSIPREKELLQYYFTKRGSYDSIHFESVGTSSNLLFYYLYDEQK